MMDILGRWWAARISGARPATALKVGITRKGTREHNRRRYILVRREVLLVRRDQVKCGVLETNQCAVSSPVTATTHYGSPITINDVGRTTATDAALRVCRILVCRTHFADIYGSLDAFGMVSLAPYTGVVEIYAEANCRPTGRPRWK